MQLKELRESAEWSVHALAVECGISAQTIYNWEEGKTCPKVRVDQLLVYCECLDVSVLELKTAIAETYRGRPIKFVS